MWPHPAGLVPLPGLSARYDCRPTSLAIRSFTLPPEQEAPWKLLRYLLVERDLSPTVENWPGIHPLYSAAMFGNTAEAQLLLDHGADV